jgi:hypothetical protein
MKATRCILTFTLSLLLAGLAACGGAPAGGTPAGGGDSLLQERDLVSSAKAVLQADGRAYDNEYSFDVGETTQTTWFTWLISSVRTTGDIDGYASGSGNKFVVLDITTTNTFEESLPMFSDDFTLRYTDEAGKLVETYPLEAFTDGMYPDDFQQEIGETTNGFVVFEVPDTVDSAIIYYLEIYEDEFEGDIYYCSIEL